jgi:hypothetical protein
MKKIVEIDVVYSTQASLLISKLKDFDKEKFEKEYFSQLVVGDKAIIEYINRG